MHEYKKEIILLLFLSLKHIIQNSCQISDYTEKMPNSYFRFKQFTVHHDRCSMKVGTDGVLLGAWADVTDCRELLDVGTGSGLISLMAAQRNPDVRITAIDIHSDSILQARENIAQSPFGDRIEVINIALHDFVGEHSDTFDAIVCNPPFFVESLLPPDSSRSNAKHAETLSLADLFRESKKIISPQGTLSVIYPFQGKLFLEEQAAKYGWFIHRQTCVYSTSHSPAPKRILVELVLRPSENKEDTLFIEIERHEYSVAFRQLVKDFYLYL